MSRMITRFFRCILPLTDLNLDRFYNGGSGLWCWVSDSYPKTQVLYFFVWAMVALGGSIICYTLVFLRTSGYLSGGWLAPVHHRGRISGCWSCVNEIGHDSDRSADSVPSDGLDSSDATTSRNDRGDLSSSVRSVARKLLL
jgi:hypothetical protein